MSFVAEAHQWMPATPEACIERLRDYPSWSAWMPLSFQPVSGPRRPLEKGDAFRVRIRGVPGAAALRLAEYEPGRLIAWTGGVPGVLEAVHAFRVEARRDGTIVHSEETWSGLLADVRFVANRVMHMAEHIGREQLNGLARALGKAVTEA